MSSVINKTLKPNSIKNLFLFRLVRKNFIASSITKIVSVLILVVAVAILIRLGFWQLQRAEEKILLLEQQSQQATLSASDLVYANDLQSLNHSPINVSGTILTDNVWLLDNQVYQGRVGYKVLAELKLSKFNQFNVMVDLGWVPAESQRSQLPNIQLTQDEIEISGLLKTDDFSQFVLAQTQESGWPRRIQSLSELPLPLGVIYAQNSSGTEFPQTYKVVVMPPEKHKAYAVQWFMLALACVLVFGFASRRGGQHA